MKRFFLTIFMMVPALFAIGQHQDHQEDDSEAFFPQRKKEKKECGTRVQVADSVISFAFNTSEGTSAPVRVLHYSYDADYNLTGILAMALPARTPQFRQIFEYDSNGNMLKYTYYSWVNGDWQPDLINNKTYDSTGHILTEDFQRKNSSGEFAAYQRHFYTYQGDVIVSYLRQVKDAAGNWYDFSHHYYIYDSMGRLTVLYGQYISSGLVFWERTAIYDTGGLVSERYLKILRYNFTLKKNVLTNDTWQKNSYNIYGNVVEIKSYGFAGNEWGFSGMDSTYYSLMPGGTKVSLCHNGNTICVSVNAVKAHLEHGDRLGSCSNENDNRDKENNGKEIKAGDREIKFSLYPNPAKNFITIHFSDNDNPYTTGWLFSSGGQLLRTFNAEGQREITLDIAGLREGTYLLKLLKADGADTRMVIKK